MESTDVAVIPAHDDHAFAQEVDALGRAEVDVGDLALPVRQGRGNLSTP